MSQFRDAGLAPVTQPPQLPLLTIGFATNPAGEQRMKDWGIERTWMRGRDAETIEDAILDFRKRPGALAIDADLRIFGHTQREILAKASEVHKLDIRLVDIDRPTADAHELVQRALTALHSSRPIRNHRTARRRGRQGGLAKAAAAANERDRRIAPEIAERLCRHKKLAWADRLEILGEGFTMSSIQRHYR